MKSEEKQKIKVSDDGSITLYVPSLDEHYHSTFGAIAESLHVYIEAGLKKKAESSSRISVLEVGLGTGLNAYLTFLEAKALNLSIDYYAVEKYPISLELAGQLNYDNNLGTSLSKEADAINFMQIHESKWDTPVGLTDSFSFYKTMVDLRTVDFGERKFDLIYFDAFAPDKQPDLWTAEIFQKISAASKQEAILTTYCCKGIVRRKLVESGFEVHKIPGPEGKREITRAYKL